MPEDKNSTGIGLANGLALAAGAWAVLAIIWLCFG